jgi:hypothetical protein
MVTLIKYKKARVTLYKNVLRLTCGDKKWQLIYPNFGVNYDFQFLTGLDPKLTLKMLFPEVIGVILD